MILAADHRHRRLLIPEKPLFFWAFTLGKVGWKGVHACGRAVRTVWDEERRSAGEEGCLFLVLALPMVILFYLIPVFSVLVVILFCLVLAVLGCSAWIALLPVCLALSVPGIVAAIWAWAYVRHRRRLGITLRCKSGQCKFRDVRLAYRCPGCGQNYRELFPSYFGIFYHRCTCGAKLPATASRGREELTKVCPTCKAAWSHSDEPLVEQFLALVGGGSVGKTCYLTMAVQSFLDGCVDGRPLRAAFESPDDERGHNDRFGALSGGTPLAPTQLGIPEAVVLRLHGRGTEDSRLYMYDAAGEEYTLVERGPGEEMAFFLDLSGVLLLVDPLGMLLHARAAAGFAPPENVSLVPLRMVVASLCRNVRRFLARGYGGASRVPLAVVLNKADCPEVAGRIGAEAICRSALSEHDVCRQAMVDWGAENQVFALERDFHPVRYFSCSALGRAPDGSGKPFVPHRVLPPLLWLLE